MAMKHCKSCNRDLPTKAFSYGRGDCKECRNFAAKRACRESSVTIWRAVSEKRCRCCGEVKSADHFNLHGPSADGLTTRCHDCRASEGLMYYTATELMRHKKFQSLLNAVPAYARGNLSPLVRVEMAA